MHKHALQVEQFLFTDTLLHRKFIPCLGFVQHQTVTVYIEKVTDLQTIYASYAPCWQYICYSELQTCSHLLLNDARALHRYH
jgi:predicted ATPase